MYNLGNFKTILEHFKGHHGNGAKEAIASIATV